MSQADLFPDTPARQQPVARRSPMLVETFTKPPKPPKPFAPSIHLCACGVWGAFGIGPPAADALRWYCRAHLPADHFMALPR